MAKLFERVKIGNMTLKNRVVMAAMGTKADPDGGISRQMKDYYVARAQGGVGLIITGAHSVTTKFEPRPCNLLDSFHQVDRLNHLVEQVHQHGAKLCVQLTPGIGRMSFTDPFTPPYSASAIPAFWFPNLMCKPYTVENIRFLVEKYGYSASLAKQAGADAIEVHAHSGYLADQFMSSLWNKRTDEYGGDLPGRMRFTLELIAEVQKTCGTDFPIIVKFAVAHYTEGGREIAEGVEIAKILQAAGVAALNVDMGCYECWYNTNTTVYERDAVQVHVADAVKKAVTVPVISQGKLDRPSVAEAVIREGKTDFVALGHALLADPEWANKMKSGKIDDIRPCIYCNECLLGEFFGHNMSCGVNPACGYEKEYVLAPAQEPKTILVVGGGPGGMECAITAARRGHRVQLWEKQDRLGGNLIPAGSPSFKRNVNRYLEYLVRQVYKCQVDVRFMKEATPEEIMKARPDVVVVAAGAKPIVPPIPGIGSPVVTTATDVLTGKQTGQRVVVVGGGTVGCETALFLHEQGKQVTLVEMLDKLMANEVVCLNNDMKIRSMVAESGIRVMLNTKLTRIEDLKAVVEKGGNEEPIVCDTVVLAVGYKSDDSLAQKLEETIEQIVVIGDTVKPRKVKTAVHEGFHAARLL